MNHNEEDTLFETEQERDFLEDLLTKYMTLIIEEESITYISCVNNGWYKVKFSKEEQKKLEEISKKVTNKYMDS